MPRKPTKKNLLPATQGMVTKTREELRAQYRSLKHEMNAGFKKVDARFKEVDARFNQVDARFNQVDARFNQVDARFNQVDARFDKIDARLDKIDARFESMESKMDAFLERAHRTQALVEEQERNNSIVFDSLHLHQQQHERIETAIQELQNTISWLAARQVVQNPIKL